MTIIYTSETGFTAKYAQALGKKLSLPVYPLTQALESLEAGRPVFYFSWVMAGRLVDYNHAKKRFQIQGVCGVGVRPDVENMEKSLKKTHKLTEIPVFYLQGGYAPEKLTGGKKFAVAQVLKLMSGKIKSQKTITPQEEELLQVFSQGGSFVSEEALAPLEDWLNQWLAEQKA